MKKLVSLLILLGMILMATVSWNNVLTYNKKGEQEYQRHLKLAEKCLEKKIYVDAASEYKKALQLKPSNYELAMKIADIYQQLEDNTQYLNALDSAIVADQTQLEPYLIQADYYMERNNNNKAYSYLIRAERVIDSKQIEDRLAVLRRSYTLQTLKFAEILPFCYNGKTGNEGQAIIYNEEKKAGLVDASNTIKVACKYDEIGLMGENLIPVKFEGEWYYMLQNGYRKKVPDRKADWLGTFSSGYAPACLEGTYGYLNIQMKEFHFEYEYAGGFAENIAAVKKGGKWYIINKSFKQLEGLEFDDVLLDDYGYCSKYGVFFAKKNQKWALYNTTGQMISEEFDEVKGFVSEEPAAVKKGEKWCFVSINGEMILETDYADVQSFCCGYAPYRELEKWGCIDKTGNVLIEPSFLNMQPFARNGYSIAEIEEGKKQYVVIKLYN